MKRKDFIRGLLVTGPVLSGVGEPEKKEIIFETLLEHFCPNDNLYVMRDGKYLDFVLDRLKPMVDTGPVHTGCHSYKFPAVLSNEDELYDQLKLMSHEMNKDPKLNNGKEVKPFRFFKEKDGRFQLQWYTINSWNYDRYKL